MIELLIAVAASLSGGSRLMLATTATSLPPLLLAEAANLAKLAIPAKAQSTLKKSPYNTVVIDIIESS